MENLVSLRKSYSEFCDEYNIKMKMATNGLKKGFNYGKYYEIALDEKLVVFYLGKWKEEKISMLQCLLKQISADQMYSDYNIRLIVDDIKQKEFVNGYTDEQVLVCNDFEAGRVMAQAGCIVSEQTLPGYFSRRPEQKVICLFDPEEDDKNVFDKSKMRINNADGVLSGFLKFSAIVLENTDQIDVLRARYQLEDIYTGEIIMIPGIWNEEKHPQKDYMLKVLRYIFEGNTQEGSLFRSSSCKKKILIYSSWDMLTRKYVSLLTESIDYDRYDVTLVLKKPKKTVDEMRLGELNEHLRVIYRAGTFACTEKEYIDTQFLIKNLNAFDDVQISIEHFDRRILRRELSRVLGDSSFEYYICMGDYSAVWTALALEISADVKLRVELQNLVREKTLCVTPAQIKVFENKIKLSRMIFQNIVFHCNKARKDAIQYGFYSEEETEVFCFPASTIVQEADYKWEEVAFNRRIYSICGKYQMPYKNMYCDMIPIPNENEKAYIANGAMCDIIKLLYGFSWIAKKDASACLYVFAASTEIVKQMAAKYQLEDRVYTISGVNIENFSGIRQYLKAFYAYITTELTEYCPIRVGMELLNKDAIYVMPDGCEPIKEKLFADIESYNNYIKSAIDVLLD